MLYYQFKVSLFKLDEAKTFVEQINNAPDEQSIGLKTNPNLIDVLHEASVRDNWTAITKEEYEAVRATVLQQIG